jgi:hypothetical protein
VHQGWITRPGAAEIVFEDLGPISGASPADPRLMVECAERPEPSSAQMIDFCLSALRNQA